MQVKGWGDDTHDVVDAPKVRSVEEVESFRDDLQGSLFGQFEVASQAHVEGEVIRTNPGIAPGSRRTVSS